VALGSGPARRIAWGAWRAVCAPAVLVALGVLTFSLPVHGQELLKDVPTQVRGLDIEERVGQTLPTELRFTNSDGQLVRLGDYFTGGKPAIIAMVYYNCPLVCDVVMEKVGQSLNQVDLTVGKDFNVLFFSIDSTETPKRALEVKLTHLDAYNRELTPEVRAGWETHTSDAASARQLADALGFKYRAIENGQFSHPVAIYMITPDAKVSRYLYGFSYPPRDVKLALIEASQGKLVRSMGDRLMSFCYIYDPKAGSYTLAAFRVMQVAGVLTVVGLAGLIGMLFVGERVRRRAASALKHGPFKSGPLSEVVTVRDRVPAAEPAILGKTQ